MLFVSATLIIAVPGGAALAADAAVKQTGGRAEPLMITIDTREPDFVMDKGEITALRDAMGELQSAIKNIGVAPVRSPDTARLKVPAESAAEEFVQILTSRGEVVKLRGIGDAVLFNLNDDAIIRVPAGAEKQITEAMAKIQKKQIVQGKQHTFIICNRRYFTINTQTGK